jgi:hypothetical protein
VSNTKNKTNKTIEIDAVGRKTYHESNKTVEYLKSIGKYTYVALPDADGESPKNRRSDINLTYFKT